MAREVKIVAVSIWLLISAIILLVIIAPYIFSEKAILSMSEKLKSEHPDGKSCSLCGMTRAFIAISEGDFDKALKLNHLSVWLYLMLCFEDVLMALFIMQWLYKNFPLRFRLASCQNKT